MEEGAKRLRISLDFLFFSRVLGFDLYLLVGITLRYGVHYRTETRK